MNKKSLLSFSVLFICSVSFSLAQRYTIEDIIARAKSQSPASRRAETLKENRYWNFRNYKASFNPQLRLDGTVPAYYKTVTPVLQDDGTYKYRAVEQMNNAVRLGLYQPIVWTNGTISANSTLNYFRNYQASAELGELWSGTVMNIELEQPLFAFNRLRWDQKIQPLLYEESRREYVEEMEFVSRAAVGMFFNVLEEQVNLQIATFNLANNDTIYKIEQGRYNIGSTSLDKLLQVELQLLRSRQAVAQANLNLETARLLLRSYIGLNENDAFPELVLPETIPVFDVMVEEALTYAKRNRAAYVSFERQRLQADRDLAQAKGNRFSTSVIAAYGLNNTAGMMNDVYVDPIEQQQVSLTFSIPIVDWGRNRSLMKRALANKKLTEYTIAQEEINFEQSIITHVRNFEMLRLQIEITKKSDQVATERYNVSQNRYLIGKIDITNLNIALNEKDEAKRSYIQALKDFWLAYHDLRRYTLYDFLNKQLLYTPTE
ncbi:MAG TPA: TolC family protein [Chryseosolibacter sp.]|nr:TolC family protein [Chryseosolibacter sp.]